MQGRTWHATLWVWPDMVPDPLPGLKPGVPLVLKSHLTPELSLFFPCQSSLSGSWLFRWFLQPVGLLVVEQGVGPGWLFGLLLTVLLGARRSVSCVKWREFQAAF